jgi:hypothetical protein
VTGARAAQYVWDVTARWAKFRILPQLFWSQTDASSPPPHRLASSAVLRLSAAIFLAACTVPDEPTAARENNLRTSIAAVAAQHEGLDAVFDSLAREAPSFAGIVFRDGRYKVLLTDITDSARIRPAVMRALMSRVVYMSPKGPRLPDPVLAYAKVRFSWLELMSIYDRIYTTFDVSRLSATDVDEEANRVVLYAATDNDAAQVQDFIQSKLSNDSARITVRIRRPATPDQLTLLDRIRPIVGGLQVKPGCTALTVGYRNAQPVLLTNSHCTDLRYRPDGGMTRQNSSSPLWGAEVHDPAAYLCSLSARCRKADLAAYTLSGVDLEPGETQAYQVGSIAKPSTRNLGLNMQNGTLDIVGAFQIIAVKYWAVSGETLERVGVTTGWQYGTQAFSCQNINYNSNNSPWVVRILCNDLGTTFSQPGDSGGPVFQVVDPLSGGLNVVLVGINHGSYDYDASNFYSNFNQMRQEIPSLCFSLAMC